MSKNCVICGKRIGDYFQDEFDVCNDYCLGIKEGRKQGALETYKNVLDKANRTVWDNNDWQVYARRKIRELEEGSTKVCDFLESPRKKLGDVEK